MRRALCCFALVVACYLPTDPYAGEVHASMAFVLGRVIDDSLLAWRWYSADTVHLAPGDSACIRFTAPANAPSYWSWASAYLTPRDLVWWTPTAAWPHLTVRVIGKSFNYDPERRGC